MIKVSKRTGKIIATSIVTFLMACLFAFTGVAVAVSVKRKNQGKGEITPTNPIVWSVDDYDGEEPNTRNWLSGDSFANRGSKAYTINSAESFLKFIEIVNSDASAEYNYFKDYTIYLNKSINMNGYHISSIGKKITENGKTFSSFQGVFDGSYYTIQNAVIDGNGLFGYTENAVIKNIGLYNCTIDSAEQYVGGILGEGLNTTIENTFVRLGSIKANKTLGGIAGKITIDRSLNSNVSQDIIRNSFVDSTLTSNSLAGIVGEIVSANNSMENGGVVSNCYFSTGKRAYYTSNMRIRYTNVLALEQSQDFSLFNVRTYSPSLLRETNAWTNYTYVEGSKVLNFTYPLLAEFVKVFMTGSSYENVMVKDGEVKNVTTLYDAFKSVEANEQAEVNIIVEKVFMNETAVAGENATIKLNASTDTVITRGENSPQTLFVSTDTSTLVLGDTDATSSTPTLVLDGDRDKVEANNLKSGVMVMAEGKDFKMGKNVVIQNNINNVSTYGGGLLVIATEQGNPTGDTMLTLNGGTITNCKAENGAGIAIFNTNCELTGGMEISNNQGNGVYINDITSEQEWNTARGMLSYYNIKLTTNRYDETIASQTWTDFSLDGVTISGNSATNGGGVFANGSKESAITIYRPTTIEDNTATNNGGGIYASATLKFGSDYNTGCINRNSAKNGGGVYANYLILNDSYIKGVENTASNFGGFAYVIGTLTDYRLDLSTNTKIHSAYNYEWNTAQKGSNIYWSGHTYSFYFNGTKYTDSIYNGARHYLNCVGVLSNEYGSYTKNGATYYLSYLSEGKEADYNGGSVSYRNLLNSNNLYEQEGKTYYFLISRHMNSYYYGKGHQSNYKYYNSQFEEIGYECLSYGSRVPSEWTRVCQRTDQSFGTENQYGSDTDDIYYVYKRELKINYASGVDDTAGATDVTNKTILLRNFNGSDTPIMSSQAVTLAENGFTRQGYKFVGWKSSLDSATSTSTVYASNNMLTADSTDTIYQPGDSYNPNFAYDGDFTVTMTAQWEVYAAADGATIDKTWKTQFNGFIESSGSEEYSYNDISSITFYKLSSNYPTKLNIGSKTYNHGYSTGDGTVLYYTTLKKNSIDIAFVSKLDIYAPEDCSELFSNLGQCTEIDFTLNFKTDNAKNLNKMFQNCPNLTKISFSNFSDAEQINDLSYMFDGCTSLSTLNLGSLRTSNVQNMSYMFQNCSNLNSITVGNSYWNTCNVENMSYMFNGCKKLESIDSANWDIGNVQNMEWMFYGCENLSKVSFRNSANIANVNKMSKMFKDCTNLKRIDLSKIKIKMQTETASMLANCASLIEFETPQSIVTTSQIASIVLPVALRDSDEDKYYQSGDIYNCIKAESHALFAPIQMLSFSEELKSSSYNITNSIRFEILNGFNASIEVDGETFNYRFESVSGLKIYQSKSYESMVIAWGNKIYAPVNGVEFRSSFGTDFKTIVFNNFDTSNVIDMKNMFYNCGSLKNIIGLNNFDTSNVTDMKNMFYYCKNLENLDLSGWNTGSVTDMEFMFNNCESLKNIIGLNSFDTGSVTDMSYMFMGCLNLAEIKFGTKWETDNVTSMSFMFALCSSLIKLDLSNFNTSNVETIQQMFAGCTSLEGLNLSSFDLTACTATGALSSLLYNCKALKEFITPYKSGTSSRSISLPTRLFDINDNNTLYNGSGTQFSTSTYAVKTTSHTLRYQPETVDFPTDWITRLSNEVTGTAGGSDVGGISLTNSASSVETLLFINESIDSTSFTYEHNGNTYTYTNKYIRLVNSGIQIFASSDNKHIAFVWENDIVAPSSCVHLFSSLSACTAIYFENFNLSDTTGTSNMFNNNTELKTIKWASADKLFKRGIEIPYVGSADNMVTSDGIKYYTTDVYTSNRKIYIESVNNGGTDQYGMTAISSYLIAGSSCKFTFTVQGNNSSEQGNIGMGWFKDGQYTNYYFKDGYAISNSQPKTYTYTFTPEASGTYYLRFDANVNNNPFVVSDLQMTQACVTDMIMMYYNCENLTSIDMSGWDTSLVGTTGEMIGSLMSMFYGCSKLSAITGLNTWDTSNVINTASMFNGCSSLTELNLSNFNTSNVKNMAYMFSGCTKLETIEFDNNWNTENVTTMSNMFNNCSSLTRLDLSSFDTGKVGYMDYMFSGCSSLESITFGKNFNTGNVKNMAYMFSGCKALTGLDLSNWNTENVTSMSNMFNSCSSLTSLDLSSFDLKSCTSTYDMLSGCTALNIFNTPKNTGSSTIEIALPVDMFDLETGILYALNTNTNTRPNFTLDGTTHTLYAVVEFDSDWQTQIKGTANGIGKNANTLTSIRFERVDVADVANSSFTFGGKVYTDTGKTLTSGIKIYTTGTASAPSTDIAFVTPKIILAPEDSSSLFYYLIACTAINFDNFLTIKTTSMSNMFYNCSSLTELDLSSWDTNSVEDMGHMFSCCTALTSPNISNWNTKNVTKMSGMFYNCSSLTRLDLTSFDTTAVTTMAYMFNGCSSLTSITFGEKFNTSNVEYMNFMFSDCSSLTELDLSNFDTGNVKDMKGMFKNCSSLTSLDVGSFDTGNVTEMDGMFNQCSSLKSLDLSKWDTSKVGNMNSMFSGCSKLTSLYLSSWDTSNVTDIEGMFNSCSSLTSLDLSSFTINSTCNVDDMLNFGTNCKIKWIKTPTVVGKEIGITAYTGTSRLYDISTGATKTSITTSDANKTFKRGSVVTLSVTANSCEPIDSVNNNSNTTFSWTLNETGNNYKYRKVVLYDEAVGYLPTVWRSDGYLLKGYYDSNNVRLQRTSYIPNNKAYSADWYPNELTILAYFDDVEDTNYTSVINVSVGVVNSDNTISMVAGSAPAYEALPDGEYVILSSVATTNLSKMLTGVVHVKIINSMLFTYNSETKKLGMGYSGINYRLDYYSADFSTTSNNVNAYPVDADGNALTSTTETYLGKGYSAEMAPLTYEDDGYLYYAGVKIAKCVANTGYSIYQNRVRWHQSLDNGTSYTNVNYETKTVDSTRKFKAEIYTITYNLDGGNPPEDVTYPNSYSSFDSSITLNDPVKVGYVFDYWTCNNDATKLYSTNGVYTVNLKSSDYYDRVYTAHWKVGDVVFDTDWKTQLNIEPTSIRFEKLALNGTHTFDDKTYTHTATLNSGIWVYTYTENNRCDVAFVWPYKIYAPVNCANLFAELTKCESIIFNNFNTSKTTNMRRMFKAGDEVSGSAIVGFITELTEITFGDNWNTSIVTDMYEMFRGCEKLKSLDLKLFDLTNCTNNTRMLDSCEALTILETPINSGTSTRTITLPVNMHDIDDNNKLYTRGATFTLLTNSHTLCAETTFDADWKTQLNIDPTSIRFESATDLTNTLTFDDKNYTHTATLNSGIWVYTYTENNRCDVAFVWLTVICAPAKCDELFEGLTKCESIIFNNFDTSNVKYMNKMFYDCLALTSLDLSNFNTVNVTEMKQMFSSTDDDNNPSQLQSITFGDSWDTGKVTTMYDMFANCKSLTELDLRKFNTDSLINMRGMFHKCSKLESINLSSFNTNKVKLMSYMFPYCYELTEIIFGDNWNTENVTEMLSMFRNSNKLVNIDLSKFNTGNVTTMSHMFYNCSSLESLDLSSFDLKSCTNTNNMILYCTALTELKTPKNSNTSATRSITLPVAMVDKDDGYKYYGENTNFTLIDDSHELIVPTNVDRKLLAITKIGEISTLNEWVYVADSNNKQATRSAYFDTVNNKYIYKTLPTATCVGYTFAGWYTQETGGEKVEADSEVGNNTTIYAHWEAIVYTVTAKTENGTITSADGWTISADGKTATKQVKYGDEYGTLPTVQDRTYTNYGWYTQATGGTHVTITTTMGTANTTIYAVWKGKIKLKDNIEGVENVYYSTRDPKTSVQEWLNADKLTTSEIELDLYNNFFFYVELKPGYEFCYFESNGAHFIHTNNDDVNNTEGSKCYKNNTCCYVLSAGEGGKTYYINVVTKLVATEIETPTGDVSVEKVYGYTDKSVTTVKAKNGGGEWIYSLIGTNKDKFELSTTSATTGSVQVLFKLGADAGEYTCQVKATSTSNATEATTGNITVTVKKADGFVQVEKSEISLNFPTEVTNKVTNCHDFTALSVTSGDQTIVPNANISIDSSTHEIKITPTKQGSVTITVTCAETTNYTEASTTFTISWKKGEITYTATGYNGEYDGEAHGIKIFDIVPDTTTVKFGTSEGNYTLTESPILTNVGTLKVYFQLTQDGYTTITGWKEIVIKAKNISTATVEDVDDQTYTGDEIKPTPAVSIKLGQNTTETVLINGTDFDYSYINNIGVGTATITITGKGNYTGSITKSFNIVAQSINDVPTEVGGHVYNGIEQTSTWNYFDKDKLTISGQIKRTDANEYIVTFKPKSNYVWSQAICKNNKLASATDAIVVKWSIAKAKLTISAVGKFATNATNKEYVTKTYDGTTNADVTLNIHYLVKATNSDVFTPALDKHFTVSAVYASEVVGKHNIAVTITSNDTTNIEIGSASCNLNGEITNKEITLTWGNLSAVYNGENQTPTATYVDVNGETKYATITIDGEHKDVGTYTARATVENYTITNPTNTFTITAKELTITSVTPNATVTKVYDGTTTVAQTFTAVVNGVVDGDDVVFTQKSATYASKDVGTGINITVIFELSGNKAKNYTCESLEAQTTGEITQREVTILWPDKKGRTFTYNGKTQKITPKVGNLVSGDTGYFIYSNGSYATNAGTYECIVNGVFINNVRQEGESANYKLPSTGLTCEWYIVKASVAVPTASTTTFTYNGSEQTYLPANWDSISAYVNISNNTRTNAGSQTVTVSLKDTINYRWINDENSDDIADKTLTFTIEQAQLSAIELDKTLFIFDNNTKTVTLKKLLANESWDITSIAQQGTDYTISGEWSATNFGTYTASVEGKGNFTGIASAEWNIGKATSAVNTVTILGNNWVGQTLIANVTTDADGKILYQWWYNDNGNIENRTIIASYGENKTLTLTETLIGKYVGVTVVIEKGTNYNAVSEFADITDEGNNTYAVCHGVVEEPTENTTTFTYNGSEQTYLPANWESISAYVNISNNTRTFAGSQTVTVSLKNNYCWTNGTKDEKTFTFKIAQAGNNPTVNMEGYTYAGSMTDPSLSGNKSTGKVTYYYNTTNSTTGGDNWDNVTSATYLSAGDYYMYAVIDGDDNYDVCTTDTTLFTISKADNTVDVEANGLVYNGSVQELVKVTGAQGEVYFSFTSVEDAKSSENTTIPTGTDANLDGYIVYWYCTGNDNYNEASGDVTATIAKADLTDITKVATIEEGRGNYDGNTTYYATITPLVEMTVVSGPNKNYGNTITATIGNASNLLPGLKTAGTQDVYFKLSGMDNYNDYEGFTKVTISATTNPVKVEAIENLVYNGSEQELVTVTGAQGEVYFSFTSVEDAKSSKNTIIPTGTDAGDYTIYWYCTGNDNYNEASGDVRVTIAKADNPIVVEGKTGLTYTGSAQKLVTVTGAQGEVYFAIGTQLDENNYSTGSKLIPEQANVSDYTIYWYCVGNNNYNAKSGNVLSTIIKIDNPIVVEGKTGLKYTGSAQELVKVTGAQGEVYFAIGTELNKDNYNSMGNTAIPSETNANLEGYRVYWYCVGNNNYNAKSGNVNVTIDKADGILELDADSVSAEYPKDATNTITKTHGGTIKVVSTKNEIATVTLTGKVITITPCQQNEVTISVTCEETENYNAKTITFTAKFTVGEIGYSVSGYTGVYDEKEHGITVTSSTPGAKISYSETENGTFETKENKYSDVGEYTVWFKIEATGYTTFTSSAIVKITPKDISGAIVTLTETLTYNGNTQTQNVTVTLQGYTNVTYNITGDTGKDADTYYLTIEGTGNFEGKIENVKWAISKATLTNSDLPYVSEDENLVYTGTTQSPTWNNYDEDMWEKTGEYEALNAGVYIARFTPKANYQLKDAEYVEVKWEIAKASLTVTAENKSVTYGDTLPSYTYTITGFVNGETQADLTKQPVATCSYTLYSDVNNGSYTITVGGGEAKNYTFTYTNATLTVNKRVVTVEWQTQTSFTYNGKENKVEATIGNLVNNDDVDFVYENNTATNEGSYTAHITGLTGAKADNYALPSDGLTLEWSIGSAQIEYTATKNYECIYDGKKHTGEVKVITPSSDATIEYSLDETTYDQSVCPIVTDVKYKYEVDKDGNEISTVTSYTVYFKITAFNYADAYGQFTITITPRTLKIIPEALSKTYGEDDPELTYNCSGNVDNEIPGSVGSLLREKGENVGEYKILRGEDLALADNGTFIASNYVLEFNEGVKFTINPQTTITSVEIKYTKETPNTPFVYDGTKKSPANIIVKVGDKELTLDTDYTLSGSLEAIKANEDGYMIFVTGINNYDGASCNDKWFINKAEVAIPTKPNDKTYNGLEQSHGISVPAHTSIVEENSTLKATNAGNNYIIEIKLDDIVNYKWSDGATENKTVIWVINPYDLSNATINDISDQSYTGEPLTPTPTVIAHGMELELDTHFTCDYENNTNVSSTTSTATVTIKPNNSNYTGTQTKEFNIVASQASFVVNDKTFTYNGEEHTIDKAEVAVEGSGTVLYSLDEENWSAEPPTKIDAGKYTIYCKFVPAEGYEIDDEEEIKTVTLTILRKQIAVPTVNTGLIYNGDKQTGVNSEEGYTLANETAINAGNHTAVATLDKNHKWNDTESLNPREIVWTIEQFDLGYATIGEVTAQEFTGNPIEPTPKVTVELKNGKTELTLGTDFVYVYENNINAGVNTATITIKAVENAECNFKNSKSINFTIAKGIVELPTAIEGLIYNGDRQQGVTYEKDAGLVITGTTSETNADTYSVIFTLDDNHVWTDNTTDSKTVTWTIGQYNVDVEWGTENEWTYDGKTHAPTATAFGVNSVKLSLSVSGTQTEASNEWYIATASLDEKLDKQNYNLGNTTAKFKINKATIDNFELEQVEFDYTGDEITVEIKSVKAGDLDATYEKDLSKTSVWSAIDANTYTVKVVGTGNFTGSKEATWKIKPKAITFKVVLSHKDMSEDNRLTYIAKDYTIEVAVYDGDKLLPDSEYDIQGNIASEVGEYKVIISGKHNYAGSTGSASFEIEKIKVDVPSYNSGLTLSYIGKSQGPEIVYDQGTISIVREYQVIDGTGYTTTTEETNVDTYHIVFKLNDPDHYEWITSEDEAIIVNGEFVIVKWSIIPTELTAEMVMVSLEYISTIFDGSAKEPIVTVQIDNITISDVYYTVEYADNTNIGTAKVTITGKNNLTGTITKQFTISETGYNISYIYGDGSSQVENVNTYDVSVEDQTIILNSPSKLGYDLDDWTISGDNAEACIITETNGNQKAFKLFIPKNSYGHITLTSVWKAQVYAIIYKLNDGIIEGKNPVSYTIETENFTLINPTKSGYKFIGWTWESEGKFGSTDEKTIDVTVKKGTYGNIAFTANFAEVCEVVFSVSFPATEATRYVKFAEFGSELDASNPNAKPLNEFVYDTSAEGANELIASQTTLNGITTITFNPVEVSKGSYIATTASTSLISGNKIELISVYHKTADTWTSNLQPVKELSYNSTKGRTQITGSTNIKVEFFTAHLFEYASESKVKLTDVTFGKNDAYMETLNEKYYIREGASWSFKFDKSNLKLDLEALVGVRYSVIDLKSKETLTGVINTGNDYFAYDESGVYTVTGLGQVLSLEEIIKTPLELTIENNKYGQISLTSADGFVKRTADGKIIKIYNDNWTITFLGNNQPATVEDVAKLFGQSTATWEATVNNEITYKFTLSGSNGVFKLEITLLSVG